MFRRVSILAILAFLCICTAEANSNFSYQAPQVQQPVNQYYQQPLQPKANVLQGNVVMVPAGATTKAMVTTQLSSQYLSTGQSVNIALNDDIDGMIHTSDLSWDVAGEEAIKEYKKGMVVKAKVLDIDVEKTRLIPNKGSHLR